MQNHRCGTAPVKLALRRAGVKKPANSQWEYMAAFDGGLSGKWRIDVLVNRDKGRLWIFWDRKGIDMRPGDTFWTVDSMARCASRNTTRTSSIDNTKHISRELAEKIVQLFPLFGVRTWSVLKARVRSYQEKISE